MNTQAVPEKRINRQVYDAIMMACYAIVEEMPASLNAYNKHYELVESLKKKIPRDVYIALSDAFMDGATTYGSEMFRLGITLGRDPGAIFDLPDTTL